MFRSLKLISFFILAFFGIFFLQSGFSYLLPYPLNQINPVYVIVTWYFVYKNNDLWLWVALGNSVLMEVFSSMPFGTMTAALIISLLLVRFLFRIIFTNLSWFNIFLLGFLTFLINKICLFLLIFIMNFILYRHFFNISLLDLYVWILESLINAAVFLLIYITGKLFKRKKIYYGAL